MEITIKTPYYNMPGKLARMNHSSIQFWERISSLLPTGYTTNNMPCATNGEAERWLAQSIITVQKNPTLMRNITGNSTMTGEYVEYLTDIMHELQTIRDLATGNGRRINVGFYTKAALRSMEKLIAGTQKL